MSQKDVPWIRRFTSMEGNDFICEVDRDYILDKFNLTDLDEQVPFFREALKIILDNTNDSNIEFVLKCSPANDQDRNHNRIQLLSSAEQLYGLIHARYILTDSGLEKMQDKYLKHVFGRCSRFYCEKAGMLPIGLSDQANKHSVRLYCPRCCDIYSTPLSNSSKYVQIDGAFFGTNFPEMFFMVLPHLRPPKPTASFVPRLYGFQIHPLAHENQLKLANAARMAKSCIKMSKRNNNNVAAAGGETNCNLVANKNDDSCCLNGFASVNRK